MQKPRGKAGISKDQQGPVYGVEATLEKPEGPSFQVRLGLPI